MINLDTSLVRPIATKARLAPMLVVRAILLAHLRTKPSTASTRLRARPVALTSLAVSIPQSTKSKSASSIILIDSCRKGYYCTQDSTLKTWCCPDEMDLAECAIAYSITGKLKTPEATTNTPMPSPTSTTVVSPLTTSIPVTIVPTTSIAAVPPEATGAANPLGASALILAAAGVLALF